MFFHIKTMMSNDKKWVKQLGRQWQWLVVKKPRISPVDYHYPGDNVSFKPHLGCSISYSNNTWLHAAVVWAFSSLLPSAKHYHS